MIASQRVCSRMRAASSPVHTSPFPTTGTVSASFTAAISSQSAVPLYIWVRVRAWRVSARAPASWQRSAISTGLRCCSLQPLRILTVVGMAMAADTARMMDCTRSRSRRQPEPPLRLTTFLTGHPKLMSRKSGWYTSSTSAAASAMAAGSDPKIWMPMGRSSSWKRR